MQPIRLSDDHHYCTARPISAFAGQEGMPIEVKAPAGKGTGADLATLLY